MEEAKNNSCLKMGVIDFLPHTRVTYNDTLYVLKVEGTLAGFFEIMSQYLGRCIEYVFEHEPGVPLSNGSWNGVLGMLEREEVDMSTYLLMNWDRYHKFVITEYMYMEEHSCGYQRPALVSDVTGFVKPYTPGVWLVILVTTLTMITFTFLGRLIQKHLFQQHRDQGSGGSEGRQSDVTTFTLESVLWTVCALLAQSVPMAPTRGVVKHLMGLWLILSLTLTTVYKSNLKAMLIMPKITLPFDTLDELVQTDLPVWVARDTIFHDAARVAAKTGTTSLGRMTSMFYSIDKPSNTTLAVVGFLEGQHVLAAPTSATKYMMHLHFSQTGGRCDTYIMSEKLLSTMGGIFLRKGSPNKPKLDRMISGLREFGILNHMLSKGISNSTECLKPVRAVTDSRRPLDLGDFYGVFYIYGAGMMVACFAFSMELTKYWALDDLRWLLPRSRPQYDLH